jgi:hypothetical protein
VFFNNLQVKIFSGVVNHSPHVPRAKETRKAKPEMKIVTLKAPKLHKLVKYKTLRNYVLKFTCMEATILGDISTKLFEIYLDKLETTSSINKTHEVMNRKKY